MFVAVLLLTLLSLISRAKAGTTVFRVGYQKAANTLVLLKAHGTLEKRLQPLGVAVTWLEFTAGPQLLEGLNAGSIDFGSRICGETVRSIGHRHGGSEQDWPMDSAKLP